MAARLEGSLPRRGIVGVVLGDEPGGGACVRRVADGGPASLAGVRPGERISSIDGLPVASASEARSRLGPLRSGDPVRLEIGRADQPPRSLELRASPRPLEQHPGCEVIYGELEHAGARLRIITVLPEGTTDARSLPFALFVQGHGSASVDGGAEPERPLPSLCAALARDGVASVRLERSGTGDSEGPPLCRLGLGEEQAQVAAAFELARRSRWASPGRGFLFAHSLGDVIACSLSARLEPRPAGLLIYGGGARTWTEYFDECCRRQWRLAGEAPAEQDRALRALQRFHALLLIERLPLEKVLSLLPEAREEPGLFGLEPGPAVRGRPASYWQDLYATSIPSLLEEARVPLLAAWGSSDWLSSREDHELLAACAGEGRGRFVEIPSADHFFAERASAAESFSATDPGRLCPALPALAASWMKHARP